MSLGIHVDDRRSIDVVVHRHVIRVQPTQASGRPCGDDLPGDRALGMPGVLMKMTTNHRVLAAQEESAGRVDRVADLEPVFVAMDCGKVPKLDNALVSHVFHALGQPIVYDLLKRGRQDAEQFRCVSPNVPLDPFFVVPLAQDDPGLWKDSEHVLKKILEHLDLRVQSREIGVIIEGCNARAVKLVSV